MNCSLSPPDCVNQPPNQGRSYDLDCLALFIDSLPPPRCPEPVEGPSPGPPSEAALRGQVIFNRADVGCATCHPAPLYTDQQKHDVGTTTADERIGPEFDTPTLRGLYDSAPYFHDGSAATLYDVLTTRNPSDQHGITSHLTEQELQDLVAFMLALPIED
jgi:cytochrome c peroxidase